MTNRMPYPTRSDYDTVVRGLSAFTNYVSLKKSILSYQDGGLFPLIYSGGRAVVYKLEIDSVEKAMKLWVQELGELSVRYKHISEFILKSQKKYLVNTHYLDHEILVNGIRYPLLLMDWIKEINLKDWLYVNRTDSTRMTAILDNWCSLTDDMVSSEISHGDLQHNNILVSSSGQIILVDYDSFYVPGLNNLSDEIKGMPGYQHPTRKDIKLTNAYSDHFSQISIYMSLRALRELPDLYSFCVDLDQLLIGPEDIISPKNSTILATMRSISGMSGMVDAFIDICKNNDFLKIPTLNMFLMQSSRTTKSSKRSSSTQREKKTKEKPADPNFEWNFDTGLEAKKSIKQTSLGDLEEKTEEETNSTFTWDFSARVERNQDQARKAGKGKNATQRSGKEVFGGRASNTSRIGPLEDALERYKIKDYRGALEVLERSGLGIVSTKNAFWFLVRGLTKLALNDYHGSISDIDYCMVFLTSSTLKCQAWVARADAHMELKAYTLSIEEYTKALSIDSELAAVYTKRGDARLCIYDFVGALEDFQSAVILDPDISDPEYYNSRGVAKHNLANYVGAISDYTKAIELDPADPIYYCHRGVSRNSLGDYMNSIADHDQAISLDSENSWYFTERGNSRFNAGYLAEAISDYKKALALNPQDQASSLRLREAEEAYNVLDLSEKHDQTFIERNSTIPVRKSLLSRIMRRFLED